jgi:hypothetical protein
MSAAIHSGRKLAQGFRPSFDKLSAFIQDLIKRMKDGQERKQHQLEGVKTCFRWFWIL